MDETVTAIQDVVVVEPEVKAPRLPSQPNEGIVETELSREISELWSNHTRLSSTRNATAKELRQIRTKLSERLYAMKGLIARPGRNGEWRGWLRERGISRSTADRLVSRHAESTSSENQNGSTGAISNSPQFIVEKAARDAWLRFRKELTTDEAVIRFITCFARISGIQHELRAEGLVIFNPEPKAPHELSCSASTNDPVPQPPDEFPTTMAELSNDTATPTETVPVVGLNETGSEVAA